MDEYIKREKVIHEIDTWLDSVGTALVGKGLSYYGELLGCVEDVPAADVAPVRHGRWELYGNADDISASYFCSLCGWNIDENEYLDYFSHYRYCPNCGAKMDKRKKRK